MILELLSTDHGGFAAWRPIVAIENGGSPAWRPRLPGRDDQPGRFAASSTADT